MTEDKALVPAPVEKPRVTDDEANRALKDMDLTQNLDVLKIKAHAVFGDWLSTPGLPQILLTKTFHTMSQVEKAIKFGEDIMNDTKKTVKERQAGANMVVIAGKAHKELVESAVKLSGRCGVPDAAPIPVNAAPDLNLQTNVHIHTGSQEKPAIIVEDNH